jgi:hypothetical protein
MDKLQKVESELVEMLLDSHEVKRYSGLLKDYSPWLANLSACKLNFDLEIPGQYSGNRLPLVQHHVKISSFCPNVSYSFHVINGVIFIFLCRLS